MTEIEPVDESQAHIALPKAVATLYGELVDTINRAPEHIIKGLPKGSDDSHQRKDEALATFERNMNKHNSQKTHPTHETIYTGKIHIDDPQQKMIITVIFGVLAIAAVTALYMLFVKMNSPAEIVLDVR